MGFFSNQEISGLVLSTVFLSSSAWLAGESCLRWIGVVFLAIGELVGRFCGQHPQVPLPGWRARAAWGELGWGYSNQGIGWLVLWTMSLSFSAWLEGESCPRWVGVFFSDQGIGGFLKFRCMSRGWEVPEVSWGGLIVLAGRRIFFQQALNTTTTKDRLLHLSYHFSLFLTISLLFK